MFLSRITADTKLHLGKNKYWVVPRGSSALFTGRAGVVGKLEQVLRSSSVKDEIGQNRYVLVGMGGVGKSEICLKVAEIVRQRSVSGFWPL